MILVKKKQTTKAKQSYYVINLLYLKQKHKKI